MKPFLVFLFVLVSFLAVNRVHAQDLIVTNKGDSINCKIIKLGNEQVMFRHKINGTIKSASLPNSSIKTLSFAYYSNAGFTDKASALFPIRHVRLGFRGGFSYLTAPMSKNVPSFLSSYYDELRSGWHIGIEASYYINKNIGFGVMYDRFNTANEFPHKVILTYPNGVSKTGYIKEDITMQYIGPAICARAYSKNRKTVFIGDFSMGLLSYYNHATMVDEYKMEGNTLAVKLNFGVDFMLDQNLALGFGISPTLGAIKKMQIDDGIKKQKVTLNEAESISRIDLWAGIRLYL